MGIDDFQFGAMMVVALLTLTLVTQVPWHVGKTVNRARWMLVGSLLLLFVQFLLQYIFGFRAQGVTQGVAVNLLFFIPSSLLMATALLYLERHGTTPKSIWLSGGLCWIATIVLLLAAVDIDIVDGRPLLKDTPALKTAEYIAALCFCATQIWNYNLHYKALRKLKRALDNYNDDDSNELLRWMHTSVMMLAVAAVFVPPAIFMSGVMLILFSILFFGTIYYCIINFFRYAVSATPELVEVATGIGEDEHLDNEAWKMNDEPDAKMELTEAPKTLKPEVKEAVLQHVENAVAQWTARKSYLHKKATLQRVADELDVPRSQLSAWLKTTDRVFNQWINNLRIEEAKRLLKEHPEWSNDSIADACGFGSRSYFQTIFKENTGITPAQFVAGRFTPLSSC